ncbi:MAG: TIGR02444 family protein [Pseudomonadota bacterium]
MEANRFWDFSLDVYARPGVEEACLSLQSRGGDVNLALWIIWAAREGLDSRSALGEAIAISRSWREAVIHPLRRARTALKPQPAGFDADAASSLRKTLLEAELNAERIQQDALYALAQRCACAPEPIAALGQAGLSAYAATEGIEINTSLFLETVSTAAQKL